MKPIGIAALLAGLAISTAAGAQGIEAGRQVVQRYCTQCHAIEGPAPPPGSTTAPPFSSVAAMPSTTELSLRAFFQTPHEKMPNLMLSPGDTANVIAFILSLRRP
jgi:mono/diheme cytochrome c family protein